ncbi:c-type cytochrome [Sphingomonas yantingensis]|jgi:cytochrome c|uniref:Cytochrome c n=2 Tax=Sphingomonas TaxID=13687 RepID=A0A7W9EGY3_9SPHN|nr:cytochrome c family protein [Sphingomonas yantingensis]MBB5697603.1 cytochrome c [Sphingomonas yantingensis]HCB74955.1 cytochrome c family protein [Sphingomonas bacterium]
MKSVSTTRLTQWSVGATLAALALAGCSKAPENSGSTASTETAAANTGAAADTAAAPAAAPSAAAVAADNTDTTDGTKLASFTGDAAKGKTDFATCSTCHAVEAGVNKIGPSLHAVVGRKAGSVAGYSYSTANKNSGITWTEDKLFQYLQNPQRVVPGTKMAFAGWSDAQKRADVIAYLKTI